MSLVLDASLTLFWHFEDERVPAVDAILDQVAAGGAVVPPAWRFEVVNGFNTVIRCKRIVAHGSKCKQVRENRLWWGCCTRRR